MYNLIDKEGAVIVTSETVPVFMAEHQGWLVDGAIYTDVDRRFEVDPPIVAAVVLPAISSTAFKMLFSSIERITAKQLRATDLGIDDFWGLLDDLRTQEVDLGLASVQAAVEYTLTKVKEAGVDLDIAERKAAILTGIVR